MNLDTRSAGLQSLTSLQLEKPIVNLSQQDMFSFFTSPALNLYIFANPFVKGYPST